jgi:hypothetical protein
MAKNTAKTAGEMVTCAAGERVTLISPGALILPDGVRVMLDQVVRYQISDGTDGRELGFVLTTNAGSLTQRAIFTNTAERNKALAKLDRMMGATAL